MFTIGDLVKRFGISRSTLIYYDKIGLITPSGRSEGNYRLYTQADVHRMGKINIYKEAGLSLNAITELLDSSPNESLKILEQRLDSLNQEINELRQQQHTVIELLGKDSLIRTTKILNKDQWVKMLEAAGMDREARRQWHIEFERTMPEAHTDFLQSLGIDADEIAELKANSR